MQVYYQIRDTPTTELFKRFDGNTTFEGVITGLAGFMDYEIRLLAVTKVGGTFKGSAVVIKTREGSKYNFVFSLILYSQLCTDFKCVNVKASNSLY